MVFVYPAVFHKDESAYWVEFPDLEGCQSFGDDVNDTVANAQEALAAYIMTLLEDGTPLPKASVMESVARPSDGFVSLVSCDISAYKDTKAVKKTLTIPAWLNDRAAAMGINFSQVLQEALLKRIA